ncbi:uncharacterized protein JN550_009776 [Neoarthrinium moseri]|uniref:uncharacterized protein n=1 Tax=Neoarthrinium moseri TaxID=1658444 RepID=UPI001FDB5FFF|nr:uncharacterized protein JN550_009776 [Neoarthrinium moseri]KAI1863250.1 hypothetical protein JN550_009776 [Neoarthrinium moseri]
MPRGACSHGGLGLDDAVLKDGVAIELEHHLHDMIDASSNPSDVEGLGESLGICGGGSQWGGRTALAIAHVPGARRAIVFRAAGPRCGASSRLLCNRVEKARETRGCSRAKAPGLQRAWGRFAVAWPAAIHRNRFEHTRGEFERSHSRSGEALGPAAKARYEPHPLHGLARTTSHHAHARQDAQSFSPSMRFAADMNSPSRLAKNDISVASSAGQFRSRQLRAAAGTAACARRACSATGESQTAVGERAADPGPRRELDRARPRRILRRPGGRPRKSNASSQARQA